MSDGLLGQGMQTLRKGSRRASIAAVAAGVLALATTAGCVVEAGVAASGGAGIAVAGPPPEPMVDARRPLEGGGEAVWVAGYWHWTGMRYTWIPGHWERPPAGVVWHPPRYFTRDGVYYYEPGGWTRR